MKPFLYAFLAITVVGAPALACIHPPMNTAEAEIDAPEPGTPYGEAELAENHDDAAAPSEAEELRARYVGLTTDEAFALADEDGRMFRIVEIDGEGQMITKDYRVGRINAAIEDDVIVHIDIEGLPGS